MQKSGQRKCKIEVFATATGNRNSKEKKDMIAELLESICAARGAGNELNKPEASKETCQFILIQF